MKKFLFVMVGFITGALFAVPSMGSAAPVAVRPYVSYVGCDLTLEPAPAHNGYGRVVVKAGTYPVDVVKHVNGKWVSTTRVAAGGTKQFGFRTSNTTTVTKFTLRQSGAEVGSTEIGKAMCIAE